MQNWQHEKQNKRKRSKVIPKLSLRVPRHPRYAHTKTRGEQQLCGEEQIQNAQILRDRKNSAFMIPKTIENTLPKQALL